jgi:hypothetical protein
VGGRLGTHEWWEKGKSARTHMNTLEQARARVRHHGGTERPEQRVHTWFVHVEDKSGARAWCLAFAVLRALGRRGGGGWA